jgi:aryl carrier-like protein
MATKIVGDDDIRQIIRAEVESVLHPPSTFNDDTDLFELGLHSLLAVRLLSRIRSMCATGLTIRHMFVTPSVNGIVAAVLAARHE